MLSRERDQFSAQRFDMQMQPIQSLSRPAALMSRIIATLLLAAVSSQTPSAGGQAPRLVFLADDPYGPCDSSFSAVNTTSGALTTCSAGVWKITDAGNGVASVSKLPETCTPEHGPVVAFLIASSPGVYGCAVANHWVPVGPRVVHPEKYRSLEEAVASAGSDSEVYLPGGYTAVLKSQLLLKGPNVTLRCDRTALILKAFNGEAIRIEGRNIAVDGCTIDGARISWNGGIMLVSRSAGVRIVNSQILNGAGTGLSIFGASDLKALGITFRGNHGSAIFAQDFLDRIEFAGNSIDSTGLDQPQGIDTIGVHTYVDGGTAGNISIHDNRIAHGGDNFAIEVGSFGRSSVPPANVSVSSNRIRLALKSNGGISLSTLNDATVENNDIDLQGFGLNIDAIELAFTRGVRVLHNSVRHAAPGTTYTVVVNGGSRNTLSGNVVDGGFYIGTSSTANPNVDGNLFQDNVLTSPVNASLPRGLVWLQCNTGNCSVSRNILIHNILRGNGSGPGITFENDYAGRGGVMDANRVSANTIDGATIAINPNGVSFLTK